MSHPWSLERGAQLQSDNSVQFSVWAPAARTAAVRIHRPGAETEHPLHRDDRGTWSATVPDTGVDANYRFVIDGVALPDPVSRWQPEGVHGPSRVVDPARYAWSDAGWRGVRMDELVIYELHVGTFTRERTFAGVIPRLADLRALGVTAIELMPVAQFPGARNWGYDGVGLYAVQNSYGGPYELQRLVDAAHAVGLGVILDVVYNHLGPEGNHLDAFGPYFTEKYKTPWGRALNYDDAESDEVRRFIIDNARYWITEYHIDGLRLDAVHGIFDFSARHLLEAIAAAVHKQAEHLRKSVVVIGESDLNDPKLVRSAAEHGFGLDGQWSDDFHHAVHAALTGERRGYYADFGPVHAIAQSLREPFVYDGKYSTHRRRSHGAPSVGVPRSRFVVAIQNHDQVGNRAAGDRLASLVTPAQLRVAAALLLWSPYVPLLFMGEEYGERSPFQYFVDHGDPRLVEAVRRGRRSEFASFGWGDDVPDPAEAATLERSTLRWCDATRGDHALILALYRDLLALRREEPLLRPDASRITVADDPSGWITLLREPADDSQRASAGETTALAALFNCSDRHLEIPVPDSAARAWTLRLSTDASGYGGSGGPAERLVSTRVDEPRRLVVDAPLTAALPPWSAALYRASRASA